jgi:hypothetical protein
MEYSEAGGKLIHEKKPEVKNLVILSLQYYCTVPPVSLVCVFLCLQKVVFLAMKPQKLNEKKPQSKNSSRGMQGDLRTSYNL